ncbi:MAG: hypothetical protein LBV32_02660 [Tannerellaceae bacterium]|nr:hypothetical protein [Tannerellaceae bacterium]
MSVLYIETLFNTNATEAGNTAFPENFQPFSRFYVKICLVTLHIFTLFTPKIPFFVPGKRPKNAFFALKRDGKGLFFSKNGEEMASGAPSGLWIFNIYSVKKCHIRGSFDYFNSTDHESYQSGKSQKSQFRQLNYSDYS